MKKNYRAILFDLDGTLLPMNVKEFTHGYFKLLLKKMAKYGIPQELFMSAMNKGIEAMYMNDGSMTNMNRFWDVFSKETGVTDYQDICKDCDEFYANEFLEAIMFTQPTPLARTAVDLAKQKAEIVALATNPVFPRPGQISRMKWADLCMDDFDLVTMYETDSFSKPNPKYFLSVCERLKVNPEDCLMVGNDVEEDGFCSRAAGIDCYIITNTMIPSKNREWDGMMGSFDELIDFLKKINLD